MNRTIDNCKKCNRTTLIVNKKHYLCNDCNFKRLNGASRAELAKRRTRKKRSSNVNPISNKQKQYQSSLKKSYREFDQKMVKQGKWYCSGCGRSNFLSHSHILRQSWGKNNGREELAFDHNNIRLHCLSMGDKKGCHEKWESGDIEQMMELSDFHRNIEYIKSVSESEYQKIVSKIKEKDLST